MSLPRLQDFDQVQPVDPPAHHGFRRILNPHFTPKALRVNKIDIGMPKDPIMAFEGLFEGGILINKEDFIAALIAALLVISLSIFFSL